MEKENIIRLTLKDNAIDYLSKAAFFVEKKEPIKWKWVTISIHGSLYHVMSLALLEGGISGVWKNEIRDGSGFPDVFSQLREKLKSFLKLYSEVKEKFGSFDYDDPSIEKLNSLRNNLIHYKPLSIS